MYEDRFNYPNDYAARSEAMLNHALDDVPYYREYWTKYDPGRDRPIDERYAAMPILTKAAMRKHFPEGAVPKDGPSAGVTVTTAILSALSGIPVRHDVAMTGEITLRGRVLAIGGLKEKTMAALRNGVKTVIIPSENESDLAEIDPLVRDKLEFVFAKTMDDVVPAAFRVIPSKENLCRNLTSTKSNLSNQQPIKSSSSHPATRL